MPDPTPPDTARPEGRVLRRSLAGRHGGDWSRLDAVAGPDALVRVFYAPGMAPDRVMDGPVAGCLTVHERRDISGGLMVVATAPAGAGAVLSLALGDGGRDSFAPDRAEPDLMAGRDVLFGQRLVETTRTVAEWLVYHHRWHGAAGAVIVNRAGAGHADFAAELGMALDQMAPAADLRVIVLDSPLPLGKPGMGPESDLYLAPDAPGKDRMTPPEPDPWLAPLGAALIPEIAKWRFLTAARAVLCVDVCDLVADPGLRPSVFDRVAAAPGGFIALLGRRIYPWRMRDDGAAAFGDHICRPFDAGRPMTRWGVAPAAAGLENSWRMHRITNARPLPDSAATFWRAMAVRVPGRRPSELAPKTALIEDPALASLATEALGHMPVRPPRAAPRDGTGGRAAPDQARTLIVTTMKNEGPFILDWIAYHRAIGVRDFLIYTNDCTDSTDTMLDLLADRGLVQHRTNPFRDSPYSDLGMKPQHAALLAAESEAMRQASDWIICMDVDEYINIRVGNGTLAALYHAMGAANMISLTWRLFGNADIADFDDRPVPEAFTRCAPELVRKPHQAWGFKTLFRNIDLYRKLGVHRPKGLRPELYTEVRWLNGSGQPMPQGMYRNGWRSTVENFGYDWVQLNHYALRSAESFLVKRDRGRVNHVDRDQGLHYWFRMNHNAEDDRSILRMMPAMQAERDRLMADAAIRAAHGDAVAAHRRRIAQLRAMPHYQTLYEALTGERLRRLSRMLHVFGSAVFNAGPEAIPADFHLRDLPKGTFFTVDHDGGS